MPLNSLMVLVLDQAEIYVVDGERNADLIVQGT
jgi:hypothetical protein